MVILLDLNTPLQSVDAALSHDTPIDTLMLIAAPRGATPNTHQLAPVDADLATSLDDDALITWEDAEWQ